MTVNELIEYLKTQPQDIQVVYKAYSEHNLLKASEISIQSFCLPRSDGWIQDARPDMPSAQYLALPGN